MSIGNFFMAVLTILFFGYIFLLKLFVYAIWIYAFYAVGLGMWDYFDARKREVSR